MELTVRHSTHYAYDAPVVYGLQKVRLRPLTSPLQEVLDWDIEVSGGKIETSYRDHYGNHVDLVSIQPGAQEISLKATGTVNTLLDNGVLGPVYGRVPLWHFLQPTPATMAGEAISALPRIGRDPAEMLGDLHALSAAILEAVPWESGGTQSGTTAEAAMAGGSGVCQDHAQIFLAAARLSGVPARYISGYLKMNDRIDQDASHAWAEAHVEGLGWVGFDISNRVSPDERYVRLAIGRDARDAAPVEGLRMGSAEETLNVSLQVQQ
jgi:transglutaminase-like putative cysteine protease